MNNINKATNILAVFVCIVCVLVTAYNNYKTVSNEWWGLLPIVVVTLILAYVKNNSAKELISKIIDKR